ncbi:MAG TPA: gephyrin-like molybdotransferase Glp [Gaiellaceae bacterium]|nr:gephyrin-like molybdotransferase Glp [Gaiellaceae bacterium]
MADLLPFEDALALVLERVVPLEAEEVELAAAAGRVLAADVRAAVDLPPFPSSAMDGYALRAADTPGTLPVTARVAAGRPAQRPLEAGEAFEISTGGVVPEGADAVVPVEDVVRTGDAIEVAARVDEGANVRPRGGDVEAAATLVGAGSELRPTTVGALAAGGVALVSCARRPRVAILSTGTELRRAGEPLAPGQIYEANAPMLAAAAAGAGAVPEVHAAVPDDPLAHREALEHALAGDVVVSSGGVSVGPHDLVRAVEAELGVEEVFWRVAVKPGKPVAFGVRGRTLVFGLPGNPVSALVGFELFVRPALRALQGAAPGPDFRVGTLAAAARRSPDRDQLLRARTSLRDGDVVLEPVRGQESHMIARAVGADALVFVRRGDGEAAAGERVDYLPL